MKFILIGFRRHFRIWDQYTLWNGQLSFQQNTRFRCDVVARHRFPKRPLGSQVTFFSQISKKDQKSRSKSGDPMMLASMANRFIGRSFLKQLQNHASNHQGAPGLSPPSDPPRKKWLLFGMEKKKENRICKVLFCQSQRKERFAQKWFYLKVHHIYMFRM